MRIVILHLFILVLLTGCGKETKSEFRPLEGGFGFASHSKESSPMHQAIWADFEYQSPNGTQVIVWPYIDTVASIQVSNGTAVFIGNKAETNGGKEALTTRLIAFKSPSGPAMDITDQVLQKWCKKIGASSEDILRDSFVFLTKTNNMLRLDFVILHRGLRGVGSIDEGDAVALFSWNDLETIIDDVKHSGKLLKEKWSGVEYLQKE